MAQSYGAILEGLRKLERYDLIKDNNLLAKENFNELFRVPCDIIKHSQQEHSGSFPAQPTIHKNTLGQILYESSICTTMSPEQPIVPMIIILSTTAVEGLHNPGIYLLNTGKSQYDCLKRFGRSDEVAAKFNEVQQSNKIKSDLAIGYSINLNYLDQEYLVNSVDKQYSQVKRLLEIHGSMEDIYTNLELVTNESSSVTTFNNFLIYPMYLIQWLVKKEKI
ncbi:hypothetical protein ACGTN9_00855 [Halobacillus sp. MO56]